MPMDVIVAILVQVQDAVIGLPTSNAGDTNQRGLWVFPLQVPFLG